MIDPDIRCETCRYFQVASMDKEHDSFCTYAITSHIPYWARYALEVAEDDVEPDDGKDCPTWSAKT